MNYKQEALKIADDFDVDRKVVENAFKINDLAGREVIPIDDLIYVFGVFGALKN